MARSRPNGDPGWIRTTDLPLRRRLLYPAELRGHGPRVREGALAVNRRDRGRTLIEVPMRVEAPQKKTRQIDCRAGVLIAWENDQNRREIKISKSGRQFCDG